MNNNLRASGRTTRMLHKVVEELISYAKEKFFAKDIRFSPMISERFFRILAESKELLFINADSGFGEWPWILEQLKD